MIVRLLALLLALVMMTRLAAPAACAAPAELSQLAEVSDDDPGDEPVAMPPLAQLEPLIRHLLASAIAPPDGSPGRLHHADVFHPPR